MSRPAEKSIFTLGKSLITVVNVVTLSGPFLADWKYVFLTFLTLGHQVGIDGFATVPTHLNYNATALLQLNSFPLNECAC